MIETNLIEDLRLLSPPDHRWLLVAGAGAMLLALLAFLLRTVLRRRTVAAGAAPAGGVAPWEAALTGLEQLAGLLRPEASRDYGVAATRVLRAYIEERYDVHAPRLATEEFLVAAAREPRLPAAHRASLGRFLELCDLFKFGRYTASTAELRELHAAAVAFVLASRPAAGPEGGEGGS